MRDGNLFLLRHLRQRHSVRRVVEDRVVTEPVGSCRSSRDLSLNCAGRLVEDLATIDARKRGDEARGAWTFRLCIEPPEDCLEALRVGGIRAKKARREHARFTVEGI